MERIGIQTTQNVDIEYQLASFMDRAYAFIIDRLIIIAYVLLWVVLLEFTDLDRLFRQNYWIIILFISVPIFLYDLISEIIFNGQSIGKKIMNTQVIRMDGRRAGVMNYLIRWVIGLFDLQMTSGSVAMISTIYSKRSQRLGDMAAGTVVIKLSSAIKLFDAPQINYDEDYTVTFQEVRSLTDQDIDIIKKALSKAHASKDPILIHTLVSKVKRVLEIETDMPPLKFIGVVIKDYHYLNSRFGD